MVDAVRRMASYAVVTGQAGGGGEDDKVADFVILLLLRRTEFQNSTRACRCQMSYSLREQHMSLYAPSWPSTRGYMPP
jgi:hypothetical protein